MSDTSFIAGPIAADPIVSVEYFPASGLSAERALLTGAHAMRRYEPAYQSVTFGAGGGHDVDAARKTSLEWTTQLQNLTEIPTAAHIALCMFDRRGLVSTADELWEQGIKRLVLLRGDAIAEGNDGLAGFASVADALRTLKNRHAFEISVAAYPEIHPKAESWQSDIDVLMAKQAAGADRAITQFFFDNNDFYRFREQAQAAGFRRALVPGIMPINNFEKISSFAEKCGAKIPEDLKQKFAAAGDDNHERTNVARELVEAQVRDLARNGVDEIHLYSLNRVDLTADAIRAFKAEFSGYKSEIRLVG